MLETNSVALNEELLTEVLRTGMKDETIDNIEIVQNEPATKKGENAMSTLTRLTVKYTCNESDDQRGRDKLKKTTRLIVKAEPPVSEEMMKSLREMGIFQTERKMLQEVVPKMEQLLEKKLGPKMYHFLDKSQTIFMEDLTMHGFRNRNRWNGLNEDDVTLVLENLADFHASSILINEQHPGYLTTFKSSILTEVLRGPLDTMFTNGMTNLANKIRTWSTERLLPLSDKCMNLSKVITEKSYASYKVDNDEFCCLNHGDMWIYNFMFRDDDEGVLQESCFVDYQVCIWTSPAIDLLHFLSVGPELKLKLSHDDIFLEKYLTRLGNTLRKIGCSTKPPTMEQLKKSMYKRRYYQQVSGLIFYPLMVMDPKDAGNIDDISAKDGPNKDVLDNPLVQKTMEKILPIMDERGYLD